MPEGVTRLATLIAGEVHISDIDRALQKDAVDKGMKIVPGKLTAIGHSGSSVACTLPRRISWTHKQPFVDKRVRQAMNMAINRRAIATNILGGKVQPMRVTRFNPQTDEAALAWDHGTPTGTSAPRISMVIILSRPKKLLKEAGYENGFEFTVYLYTPAWPA